jgi:hypothetical protein
MVRYEVGTFNQRMRRLRRSFSKTLEAMGKRLMGRKEVNWCGGFPGFGMRIIWATFH